MVRRPATHFVARAAPHAKPAAFYYLYVVRRWVAQRLSEPFAPADTAPPVARRLLVSRGVVALVART